MPKNIKNAFTLIEFLIALVIIGFIVAILVGVFSSPLKQAKTDSAISQVKDGMRQVADAVALADAKGTIDLTNWIVGDLVTGGYLTAAPAVPAGIQTTGNEGAGMDWDDSPIGGCGAGNPGVKVTLSIVQPHVTEEFCSAFNAAQGLPAEPVKNCAHTDTPCAGGSQSVSASASSNTSHAMHCYDKNGQFRPIFNTGLQIDTCP